MIVRLIVRLLALLLVLAATGARAAGPPPAPAAPVSSAPASSAPVSPTQADQVLHVLKDDKARAQLITTLESIAKALPAQPEPAVPANGAKPAPATPAGAAAAPAAGQTAAPPAASAKPAGPLAPDSLGAQVLVHVSEGLATLGKETETTVRAVTNFPLIWRWVSTSATDPALHAAALDTSWKLIVVLAIGLAVEWLVGRGTSRLRAGLYRRVPQGNGKEGNGSRNGQDTAEGPAPAVDEPESDSVAPPEDATGDGKPVSGLASAEEGADEGPAPLSLRHRGLRSAWTMLRRLPFTLVALLLDLVPALVFGGVGNLLLSTPLGTPVTTRLVILAVVNAYVVCRLIICAVRGVAAPDLPRLRLLHASDATAAYIVRWVRRLVIIAVTGIAIAEVGLLFGTFWVVHEAILKLTSLIVHLLLVVIVLQSRASVAARLRARSGAHGAVAAMRNWFARVWHWVAIFFILGIWVTWAIEIRNGFSRLLYFLAVTVIVLVAVRILSIVLLGALDRAFRPDREAISRYPAFYARAQHYHPVLRRIVSGIIAAITVVALLQVWGVHVLAWFLQGQLGGQVLSSLVSLVITILLATIVWEAVNVGFERHLERLAADARPARAARLRTLLPVVRTTLLITLLVIVGLMVLSDIGVNIAPLLAGAGIVGVAIGFGSQKLVQDFITGMFLLLENAMQVGDFVTLGGLSGTVEKLSIRTIRLRASDGSVHIIPFSSVTTVTNVNRGLGNASVNVTVAFHEDTDRVCEALKDIVTAMRKDPDFQPVILSDLQVWGVDKVDGASATILGQISCTDSGRWKVQREFNRRLKKCVEELGIELAVPAQSILLRMPAGMLAEARSLPAADTSSGEQEKPA